MLSRQARDHKSNPQGGLTKTEGELGAEGVKVGLFKRGMRANQSDNDNTAERLTPKKNDSDAVKMELCAAFIRLLQ